MSPAKKTHWYQIGRDVLLSGALIFGVLTFWNTSGFIKELTLFMQADREYKIEHKIEHATINRKLEILIQKQVARDQKPLDGTYEKAAPVDP